MNRTISKLSSVLVIVTALLITNCKSDPAQVMASEPFATKLMGKWQWLKTVTPSGEVSPQTTGYNKSLSCGNDGGFGGNYLLLSQDGKKKQVAYQNNSFGSTDLVEQSLTAQFGSKYIKFFLVKSSDNTYQDLITTDLVDDYTQGFGSTRHYYKRVGAPDKP